MGMKNYNFKGEKNNYCKLTDKDVELIREFVKSNKLTYRKLGQMFKVSHSHIYKIVNNKTRTA